MANGGSEGLGRGVGRLGDDAIIGRKFDARKVWAGVRLALLDRWNVLHSDRSRFRP